MDSNSEITDKRKSSKGIDCWTTKTNEIAKYYKLKRINSMELCMTLIGYLCEEQLHSSIKFLMSPFEKDPSL